MSLHFQYDFSGLLKPRIGEGGVDLAEVQALEPRLKSALEAARAMRAKKAVGFWDLPYDKAGFKQVSKVADSCKGFHTLVVVGFGGAALGASAVCRATEIGQASPVKTKPSKPRVLFIDNIDPAYLSGFVAGLDLKGTLFNVVCKTGETIEVLALMSWLVDVVRKKVGKKKVARHFIVTTDKLRGSLLQMAEDLGCANLEIPANVGHRYSVLSAAGLFPAMMSGIRVRKILQGAAEMEKACNLDSWMENPALAGAAFHYLMYASREKRLQVIMPYSTMLMHFSEWFRRLWSESLGKALDRQGNRCHHGQTPVRAVGSTCQHSLSQLFMEGPDDKVMTFITAEVSSARIRIPRTFSQVESAAYLSGKTFNDLLLCEARATEAALGKAGRPSCAIRFRKFDEKALGALFMLMEAQTVLMAELLDVNAFDQPGVELSRQYTYGILGRSGYGGKKSEAEASLASHSQVVVKV